MAASSDVIYMVVVAMDTKLKRKPAFYIYNSILNDLNCAKCVSSGKVQCLNPTLGHKL